jgi:Domain of unknown function (DUF5615)
MSRPRFLADEDLRNSIVHAVRRMESDVDITTLVDAGQSSASDEEVLDYAWEHQRLLLSHDVNTMRSLAEQRIANGAGMHGLFLVPQSRPTRPVAESVVLIWSASEFEEWRDRIVYLPL